MSDRLDSLLATPDAGGDHGHASLGGAPDVNRLAKILAKDGTNLLEFVAKVNKLYQEKLHKDPPFMTFVLVGVQSAGKSTIVERFMHAVLNIVQQGTGTRCPLDVTCIHDPKAEEPICDLSGQELLASGHRISLDETFRRIVEHNRNLGAHDRFSTKPLVLIFRSKDVQNMRFVDTPGIISNQGTGRDNREDIKRIIEAELNKTNSRLCVILEPKEFETNGIVNFCDEKLGGRDKWIHKSIFLMNKFDKQMDDTRTASRANGFFKTFHDNRCFPYLVTTETLPNESLPAAELFAQRQALLAATDNYEQDMFDSWRNGHSQEGDQLLSEEVSSRIGFATAKTKMWTMLLADTMQRLPEVISSLRSDLDRCHKEQSMLREKTKMSEPDELKNTVLDIMADANDRMVAYLDGNMEVVKKFPDASQKIIDEIIGEAESGWRYRELNCYTEQEDASREQIRTMFHENKVPGHIQANKMFFAGKQYQRAVNFSMVLMKDALTDPHLYSEAAANAAGYLSSNIQQDNREGAMQQIVEACIKPLCAQGINYLVKHVGYIFRRLFKIALRDIQNGGEKSRIYKLLPAPAEEFICNQFDDMVWKLMDDTARTVHIAVGPMYLTINPSLSTYHSNRHDDAETLYVKREGDFVVSDNKRQAYIETYAKNLTARMDVLKTNSVDRVKTLLKEEDERRSEERKPLVPGEQTSMITDAETTEIISRSFEYTVGLLDFILDMLKMHFDGNLFIGFKKKLRQSFAREISEKADWDNLVERDERTERRKIELEGQIIGLKESLADVKRFERSM